MVCNLTSQELLQSTKRQTQMPKEMNITKSQPKHTLFKYQLKGDYFSQYNNSEEAKKL
jgi:hypothetical protein